MIFADFEKLINCVQNLCS